MLPNQGNNDIPAPANDAVIFDVGTTDFEDKVMRVSLETPVLVDFWAPWCGPCKQLGPVLEAAVQKAGGKVRLAKADSVCFFRRPAGQCFRWIKIAKRDRGFDRADD